MENLSNIARKYDNEGGFPDVTEPVMAAVESEFFSRISENCKWRSPTWNKICSSDLERAQDTGCR